MGLTRLCLPNTDTLKSSKDWGLANLNLTMLKSRMNERSNGYTPLSSVFTFDGELLEGKINNGHIELYNKKLFCCYSDEKVISDKIVKTYGVRMFILAYTYSASKEELTPVFKDVTENTSAFVYNRVFGQWCISSDTKAYLDKYTNFGILCSYNKQGSMELQMCMVEYMNNTALINISTISNVLKSSLYIKSVFSEITSGSAINIGENLNVSTDVVASGGIRVGKTKSTVTGYDGTEETAGVFTALPAVSFTWKSSIGSYTTVDAYTNSSDTVQLVNFRMYITSASNLITLVLETSDILVNLFAHTHPLFVYGAFDYSDTAPIIGSANLLDSEADSSNDVFLLAPNDKIVVGFNGTDSGSAVLNYSVTARSF